MLFLYKEVNISLYKRISLNINDYAGTLTTIKNNTLGPNVTTDLYTNPAAIEVLTE